MGVNMRPSSIVWFERLIFATLLLGLIQIYFSWDESVALAANVSPNPGMFTAGVQIFTFALIFGLTLLISRRRSKIAMWVSIILFVLGLPAFVGLAASGLFHGLATVSVAQTLAQLVAYGLLFRPAARAWMRGEDDVSKAFL